MTERRAAAAAASAATEASRALPRPEYYSSALALDGSNKRGRPRREWSDDIEQWCGATLQELGHAALDRQRWAAIVTMASDTNGR